MKNRIIKGLNGPYKLVCLNILLKSGKIRQKKNKSRQRAKMKQICEKLCGRHKSTFLIGF